MSPKIPFPIVTVLGLAANLLATFAGASAEASAPAPTLVPPAAPGQTDQLNHVSLAAMEQSWLSLPRVCKARGATFEPFPVGREASAAHVLALHAALDQAGV